MPFAFGDQLLTGRDGTLLCSAGSEWYGYLGIIDTEASTWAPPVGRPSKSAGCLAAQKKKKNSRQSRRTSTDKVAQEILLSICKAELKEVNGHEHEQHQASDSQTQLTTHQSRRQLLISSPLQTCEDVQ